MIGHLGSRVSALLDGQLDAEETERAWAHVHACHQCRDLVEREGWVKTRLAGLSFGGSAASDRLKGSLLQGSPDASSGPPGVAGLTPGDAYLLTDHDAAGHRRRATGLVALGGGAVGAVVMGVLVLAVAPADAPPLDRRGPATQLVGPTRPATTGTPTGAPGSASTGASTGKRHKAASSLAPLVSQLSGQRPGRSSGQHSAQDSAQDSGQRVRPPVTAYTAGAGRRTH